MAARQASNHGSARTEPTPGDKRPSRMAEVPAAGHYSGKPARANLMVDPLTLAVAALCVFIISFTKGAFGGGFAIIGIPLLALVMDPLVAGAFLAPLFCIGDVVALRYWRPSTWSRPDLQILVPGQLVGMGLGFLLLNVVDRSFFALTIALITLLFTGYWFMGGRTVVKRPRSLIKGVAAGTASGVTSMVAHAGGPPVAMYLLPLGLPKGVYAGTTYLFFVVSNFAKVGPWLVLAPPTPELWWLIPLSVPVIVVGVWVGWRLHALLDQRQLYSACYALLVVVGLKLLWDALKGYGVI
jgi:uncharacterized protein